MRILVDTNVFLDLLFKRDGESQDALRFFLWCNKNNNQVYITSMSLRDIEYIVMRTLHDRKKANLVLSDVYSLCNKVVGISGDAAISAIFEDYKDFEDELIIQTANIEMVDVIVTNNAKDFKNSTIPAFSPKDVISFAN